MQSELEQRLYKASKEHLVQLFQELATRHPILQEEMERILVSFSAESLPGDMAEIGSASTGEADEELLDDWDFSGDEPVSIRAFPQPISAPVDSVARQQLIEKYALRLRQQDTPQGLLNDLSA